MPRVIVNGPQGKLEGHLKRQASTQAPSVLVLHSYAQFGGDMDMPVVQTLSRIFYERGFTVLRFNFRGAGRSEGVFDNGKGELSDAATMLDWLQKQTPDATECWIAGFAFGGLISMQLLMRRPELSKFIALSLPANTHDFSFLSPCPSSGIIIYGEDDKIVPLTSLESLHKKLKNQMGIKIKYASITGGDHFFHNGNELMQKVVADYIDKEQGKSLPATPVTKKRRRR